MVSVPAIFRARAMKTEGGRLNLETQYAIEMLNITKRFPGIIANDNITLQLRHGEIHALLGENGAGKSTLMSVLFGMYQPEEGIIKKNGEVVTIRTLTTPMPSASAWCTSTSSLWSVSRCSTTSLWAWSRRGTASCRRKEAREKVMALSEKYGLQIDPDAPRRGHHRRYAAACRNFEDAVA